MKPTGLGPHTASAAALALAALAVLPASAAGAAGPSIPSISWNGSVTAPSSDHSYAALGSRRDTVLTKIEKGSGEVVRSKVIRGAFGLPAVTQSGTPGGLSADGGTLALVRAASRLNVRETEFAIVNTDRLKVEPLALDGAFSFDAISPDGRWMYVTAHPDARDPYDYSVRAYDLERRRFQSSPIVDPSEPDEAMTGLPLGRVMSPDGRWAYTLYAGGEETFVHALDTIGHTAVCIDVPQIEDVRNIYKLGLEPTGAGRLVVLNSGEPAAFVDTETFEVSEPPVEESSADSGTDSGGIPWLVIGMGALGAGALALAIRRRRRMRAVGSEDLEQLVRVPEEPKATEREKEWDPAR
jgi:hypothetical protein